MNKITEEREYFDLEKAYSKMFGTFCATEWYNFAHFLIDHVIKKTSLLLGIVFLVP